VLVFAFVNLVPVIFDAAAAVRAVHTSKFFGEPEPGAVPAAGVVADPLAPVPDVLAGGTAAAGFDPPEHAVADTATRIRLAAANTGGTRMSSPFLPLLRRHLRDVSDGSGLDADARGAGGMRNRG
jgi:hypothetical protein